MEKQGWVSIWRKLMDDPLWLSEIFTKAQAWVDLILLANHKESGFQVRGNWVYVKRGEFSRCERELAKRWKWSRDKVKGFLKYLEKEGKIIPQKKFPISIYAIVNYNTYQSNHTTDQSTDQSIDPTNTIIINNENKKTSSDSVAYSDKKSKQNLLLQKNLFDAEHKFNELWEKYPNKIGKSSAYKHFKKNICNEQDYLKISRALNNYCDYIKNNRIETKYIKHGSSWFNQWKDWEEVNNDKPKATDRLE